jgi:GMP synthase (glutamine-hydrolysing)
MAERRVLILKTGELPREVREGLGPYERAFFALLGEGDRFAVVDARREELPERPPWAAVIVTGSPASVYDGDRWIARSEDFLRRAADRGVPIYGICFGHQLVAQAFGGRVEKCPRGWELGTVRLSLTAEGRRDPLFDGLPADFAGQQTHGDVVTELPPGAVPLAANDHWPVQAFRLADAIWGTQFHPEFTATIVRGMIRALCRVLSPEAFPERPRDRSVLDWLLSRVDESRESVRCLRNFVALVEKAGP